MLQVATHDADMLRPSKFGSPSSLAGEPVAPSGYSSDEESVSGLAQKPSDSDDEYPVQRDEGADYYSD
jgi:hypothetical protein